MRNQVASSLILFGCNRFWKSVSGSGIIGIAHTEVVFMKKKLPIGIDSFREIRETNRYYVDKTLMIDDFLQYEDKVSLITRPRRFGKTLNMTMLREFFDVTKNSQAIFTGLNIMETESACKINKVPVIFLSFKNCDGYTLRLLKKGLFDEIFREYQKYAIYFEGHVNKNDFGYIQFYHTLDMMMKNALTDENLMFSVTYLMEAIHAFYQVKPIVLIDEYDQPLIVAYEKGFRKGNFF